MTKLHARLGGREVGRRYNAGEGQATELDLYWGFFHTLLTIRHQQGLLLYDLAILGLLQGLICVNHVVLARGVQR